MQVVVCKIEKKKGRKKKKRDGTQGYIRAVYVHEFLVCCMYMCFYVILMHKF